jgi:hypothetical protein
MKIMAKISKNQRRNGEMWRCRRKWRLNSGNPGENVGVAMKNEMKMAAKMAAASSAAMWQRINIEKPSVQ